MCVNAVVVYSLMYNVYVVVLTLINYDLYFLLYCALMCGSLVFFCVRLWHRYLLKWFDKNRFTCVPRTKNSGSFPLVFVRGSFGVILFYDEGIHMHRHIDPLGPIKQDHPKESACDI